MYHNGADYTCGGGQGGGGGGMMSSDSYANIQ